MRRFVALVAAALLGLAGPAFAQGKELLLFNWSNYMSPDLLKRFEAETGIKVRLDTYDTNESMLAKLQAGGAGYDVVVPTGPTVQLMIRQGLLEKIDAGAMANAKNIKPPFDHPVFDPEHAYSVPYMWGTTGIGYDTAAIGGARLDDSWKEIFEPRPEFAGHIGMLSDVGEVFIAAAFYLGLDRCTEKPEDGQKILDLLQKQKPSVKLYSASGTIDRIVSGEVTMAHMWNGSVHRAHMRKGSIAYLYPREGSNLWGDNFAVVKAAPHLAEAKIFLNWMMDPKNAAEASNYTGYNNAIAGSEPFLSQALKDDPAVNMPAEYAARLSPTTECPKGSTDLRQRIWTRLQR
jgi:spermidine/putrescine transport system substrate-binding protein